MWRSVRPAPFIGLKAGLLPTAAQVAVAEGEAQGRFRPDAPLTALRLLFWNRRGISYSRSK